MNKVTEQLKTNNVKLKGIVTQVSMLLPAPVDSYKTLHYY